MLRAAHLLGAGLLILSCLSAAEARHYRYYWGYPWFGGYARDKAIGGFAHDRAPDMTTRELDPRFSERRSGSTLGAAIDRLIGICGAEVAEFGTLPTESIARAARLDSNQAAVFEDLRRTADETANMLAADCPKDIEPAPSGRIEAVGRSLDTVDTALDKLQPLLQTFYGSLREEQKVGLLATSGIAGGATSRAESPRVRVQSRSRAGVDGEALGEPFRDQPRETPPPERNCEQWGAELRAWPVGRVEEIIDPGPRQRAAFYELAASFQHAADLLADTCPSEPATALMTPLGRIAETRKGLDAVRQSIALIRPAIARFDELLDGAQRKRLRDAM